MRAIPVFILFVVLPGLGLSKTIYVPDNYPTIQVAINNSSNGDTVIVKSGTYVENINYQGKAITVMSLNGPATTIIDGGNPAIPQYGSVVTFNQGEGHDSVLDGFTLTNGIGTTVGGPIYTIYGGGIYCLNSSPTIINNIISDNSAIEGGGFWCRNLDPHIIGNTIRNNTALAGAGIDCEYALPVIMNNYVSDNFTDSGLSWGGGVCCFYSSPEIVNNIIVGNRSDYRGGGIYCRDSSLALSNNTLMDNSATKEGGGIHGRDSSMSIFNTILWDNEAPLGEEISAGFYTTPSALAIDFSNVRGGQSYIHLDPGCTLAWGSDNLFGDPPDHPLLDGAYRLTWLSPCINRGTAAGAPLEDIDGDPRPNMGTVDTGADEYSGNHSLEADVFAIPEMVGGQIHFSLQAGLMNGGRGYIVMLSVSGTNPGTPLPGSQPTLPLNWDSLTGAIYFFGLLDPNGNDPFLLDSNGPIPGAAGLVFSFAYALLPPTAIDFVSNPINITIVP